MKMTHRFLGSSALLLTFILCIFNAQRASAEILFSGQCGDNAYYSIDDSGSARIYGTGLTWNYACEEREEDSPLSDHYSLIKSAVIESGITGIGSYLLSGCYLTSVSLPAGLTEIGQGAFLASDLSGNITLPLTLEKIGDAAFMSCSELTGITIPENVTSIGTSVFNYCNSLVAITVDAANQDYSSENGVLFDKAKTRLMAYPCAKYGDYVIPGTVTDIDPEAFLWAVGLTSVTIPESVTDIGYGAFESCEALTDVTLPGSVSEASARLFYGCTGLQEVTLGSGILNIDYCAFHGCTSLYTVHLPDTLQAIGEEAFSGCEHVGYIEIPDGTVSIGPSAFSECWSLRGITVPSSVTAFGELIFEDCTGWLTIYGSSPSAAENYANENEITFMAVSGRCGDNVSWALNDGNLEIFGTGEMYDYTYESSPFARNTSISSICILNGVTRIGTSTFQNCSALDELDLPDSLLTIGSCAFMNCTSLTEFFIPEKTHTVEKSAFAGCTSLSKAYFYNRKDYPMSFGSNIYDKTDILTVYCRPGTMAYIDAKRRGINYHLIGAITSPDYVLPDDVTEIGEEAFAGTPAVQIWLNEKVTSIGSRAFAGSMSLEAIYIPGSCTSIAPDAFENCRSDLVICGHEGTPAKQYAADHGYEFAYVPAG